AWRHSQMPTEQFAAGITSVGVIFALCMVAILMVVPRRLAMLPIAVTACYMTFGQQIVIAGLHFTILRMLIIASYTRVLLRGEYRGMGWQRLDTIILAWAICGVTMYTILLGTTEALVNRLGVAYNTVGIYIVCRWFIRDLEDIRFVCRLFALVLFPV